MDKNTSKIEFINPDSLANSVKDPYRLYIPQIQKYILFFPKEYLFLHKKFLVKETGLK